MSMSEAEVKKVAHLARLAITDDMVEVYARGLSNILDLVEQLSTVDTEGIEPLAHPLETNALMRDDVVTGTNNRELYQSIAPEVKDGRFIVPKVID